MKLSDFVYDLPEELIAKYPESNRQDSRLLQVCNNHSFQHKIFKQVEENLNPGDLLVLNNTKVIPARFYGAKPTGAKLEFLLERVIDDKTALVHIKANRAPKPESIINLINTNLGNQTVSNIKVIEKQDNLYRVLLCSEDNQQNWYELLEQIGKLPLPPYIDRELLDADQARYQTVYAQNVGAVAAPTAGLHFTDELLQQLANKGVIIKYITLHVGSGTFAPVRVDNIKEHKMHSEYYAITDDVIDSIIELKNTNKLKEKQGEKPNKIVSVGTTSLRSLEAMASSLEIGAEQSLDLDYSQLKQAKHSGDTDIFIYPGYKFKLVDSLITNFHLPGSTLMMLVSAFAGMDSIKQAYQEAIENKYRFFSYGDAMWLDRV